MRSLPVSFVLVVQVESDSAFTDEWFDLGKQRKDHQHSVIRKHNINKHVPVSFVLVVQVESDFAFADERFDLGKQRKDHRNTPLINCASYFFA